MDWIVFGVVIRLVYFCGVLEVQDNCGLVCLGCVLELRFCV